MRAGPPTPNRIPLGGEEDQFAGLQQCSGMGRTYAASILAYIAQFVGLGGILVARFEL